MEVVISSRLPVFCMLIISLLLLLFSAAVVSAKNAAPAPAVDCSSLVLTMADCLSFVTEGSTTTTPEGTCCSGLKTVLKTDAECLCETFRNSAQLGVTINMTKALALPSACHVSAPSVTNCGLSVGTGPAPALSPLAVVSPSSVAGAPTASPGGANEVAPAPAPGSSGSSALTTSTVLLVFATLSLALFSEMIRGRANRD